MGYVLNIDLAEVLFVGMILILVARILGGIIYEA